MSPSSGLTELRGAVRGLRRSPTIAALRRRLHRPRASAPPPPSRSAVDRALVQRLPFRDPGRIVTVYRTTPALRHRPVGPAQLSRSRPDVPQHLPALGHRAPRTGLLALPGDALQVSLKRVTGNLFPMLGVAALHGRLLLPEDDGPTGRAVAVLSEEVWRERFGGDPGDRRPHDPAGRRRPHGRRHPAPRVSACRTAPRWPGPRSGCPMRFTDDESGDAQQQFPPRDGPAGRRRHARDGATRSWSGSIARLAETDPDLRGEGLRVLPLQAEGARAVRAPLLLLFAAAAIVLLIAATNVASLLLARGVQRGREVAIRTALGGTRAQVMRPAMLETVVLTAVGPRPRRPARLARRAVDRRHGGRSGCRSSPGSRSTSGSSASPSRSRCVVALLAGAGARLARRRAPIRSTPSAAAAAAAPAGRSTGCSARSSWPRWRSRSCCSSARGWCCAASRGCSGRSPGSTPSGILTLQATVSADRYPGRAARAAVPRARARRGPRRCPAWRRPRRSRCCPTSAGAGTSTSATRASRATIRAGCRWWSTGS